MSNSFSDYNPVVYSIKPKNGSFADEVLIFFDNSEKAVKYGTQFRASELLIIETCFPETSHQEHEARMPYYVLSCRTEQNIADEDFYQQLLELILARFEKFPNGHKDLLLGQYKCSTISLLADYRYGAIEEAIGLERKKSISDWQVIYLTTERRKGEVRKWQELLAAGEDIPLEEI